MLISAVQDAVEINREKRQLNLALLVEKAMENLQVKKENSVK
jgi:hypothetical protein